MAISAQSSPPQDLAQLTIATAKAWALALTSYLGSLAALVGGYFGLRAAFPDWHYGLVLGIAVVPLALSLLTVTLPAWLRRRRDRKLVEEGINGSLNDPEYFRIWPYDARDRARYSRPDGAHEDILRWIREARSPVLYLTGRSGTGKSSLLNAWVLPQLKEDDPPHQSLVVRSYRDPLAELTAKLGEPGAIWEKPPSDLAADPRVRLERAAAYLGAKSRLLIVLDQFEEFVILQEPDRRAQLEAFLRDLIERPIPRVITLLVLRSDYFGALDQLDLPLLRQHHNWREIGPFTQAAAAAFLDGSGLKIGPELRREVLKEAAEIEENPGLIRPIILNMFGVVLSRFEGYLPRDFTAGRLLTSYLRDELNKPEVREHAVAIVRNMVTDAGTKRPRSEAELAARTSLDTKLVRGCLLVLGSGGLVRPLDASVWEVAHDFVARLLAQVVSSWRTSWWRSLQPWVAPASLLLWVGVVFVALPAYRTHLAEKPFSELRAKGIQIIRTSDVFHVSLPDSLRARADLVLRDAASDLEQLGALELDLSNTQISDLVPLANLTNLKMLDLSGTEITDVTPLANLTNLEMLDLSGTEITDATPLANLTNLQALRLGIVPSDNVAKYKSVVLFPGPEIDNAAPLAHLINLRALDLSGTLVADAAPLANLTNLQALDLSGTQLVDTAPLTSLTSLERLDLTITQVSDLVPLGSLTNLKVLGLAYTQISDLPHFSLTNLEELDLSGTRIADAAPLADLTNLQWLSLAGTRVDDAALLAGLAKLQFLDLSNTQVSQEQVTGLERAFAERGNRSVEIRGP